MGGVSDLLVCHLGQVEYTRATDLQERLRERVRDGELGDTLLCLEHPPVYTLGRRSVPGELPLGEEHYRAQGIDVVRTRRGGKLTYHGPGQLVGYPIMHVGDVLGFVRTMEGAIATALAEVGIEAHSREDDGLGYIGVWVEDRKIASVGIHVSRGVTMHGFAVNVDNDVEPFHSVVACGLPDVRMTSVALEGGAEALPCFRKRVAHRFAEAFGMRQRLVTRERLGLREPVAA
jgi:lipoyl(octanoyl) transferase